MQYEILYLQPSFLSAKPNLLSAHLLSIPISDSTHFRVIPSIDDIRTHPDGQLTGAKEFEKPEVTSAACVMSESEKNGLNTGHRSQNKTDSPCKRKGHLCYAFVIIQLEFFP